jgi:hypothetical protein
VEEEIEEEGKGFPQVDYFSLDVEGVELGILESLPWDKVDIRVLQVGEGGEGGGGGDW